jgi:hypothetical protein
VGAKDVDASKDHLGGANMRLIAFVAPAFVAATFVAGSPVAAQEWREYAYPDHAFTVVFPASPRVETTAYQLADGRTVPARVYSVRENNGVFAVTVAEIGNTGLDENAVIENAIKMLSAGGEVKVNMPHRIYKVYGRQLSIQRADGSRSTVGVFDYNGRLYLIEGKMAAGGNLADLLRFQQSLVFTDGGSNRSAEAIRAVREACRGLANVRNAGGNPAQPAGPDDPRCQVVAPE